MLQLLFREQNLKALQLMVVYQLLSRMRIYSYSVSDKHEHVYAQFALTSCLLPAGRGSHALTAFV